MLRQQKGDKKGKKGKKGKKISPMVLGFNVESAANWIVNGKKPQESL